MDFDQYQAAAKRTAKMDLSTDGGRVELVLGLGYEFGSVSNIYKKMMRDGISLASQREALTLELGDTLWYLAMAAESMGIRLSEIASKNLQRIDDRYDALEKSVSEDFSHSFDEHFPEQERLPQTALFHLEQIDGAAGLPHVKFTIEASEPNPFPDGGVVVDGKKYGYTFGRPIGSVVNDNTYDDDGYRFHDALHIAFMAVLGWSPVMRALLRVKRKSDQEVDRVEDGARARDLEEALSAQLKALSKTRNSFQSPRDVDDETRDLIRRVISDLEVRDTPLWLWAEAIHQGFSVMEQLRRGNGGWVVADRSRRRIEFHAERPAF